MSRGCARCGGSGRIYRNLRLCRRCLLETVERRLRKTIRTKVGLKRNSHIVLLDDRSAEFMILDYIFRTALKYLNLDIKYEPIKNRIDFIMKAENNSTDKTCILPWSAEDEASLFLNGMFGKLRPGLYGYRKGNLIKLPRCLSASECELFAGAKGWDFRKRKMKDNVLNSFIREKPELVFGLLNSIDYLLECDSFK